jgi:hypothetical protein
MDDYFYSFPFSQTRCIFPAAFPLPSAGKDLLGPSGELRAARLRQGLLTRAPGGSKESALSLLWAGGCVELGKQGPGNHSKKGPKMCFQCGRRT